MGMRGAAWGAVLMLGCGGPAAAEMIYLKNGKRVEAKVTERTDKYVKVDWLGVGVTYWMDEVDRIDTTVSDAVRPSIAETPGAAALAPQQQALVAEVLELAGAKAFLRQFQDQVPAEFDRPERQQRMAKLPPEARQQFRQMMLEAFAVDLLYPAVESSVAARFDQARLTAVASWLRGPLAVKITALESRPVDRQQLEQFVQRLPQQMPAPARLALVGRLDEAVRGSDLAMDSIAAMLAGMSHPLTETGRVTQAEAQALITQTRQQLAAQYGETLHDATLAQMLFVYQPVSDAELEQYVAWWESADGRWFGRAFYDAVLQALTQASARMGEQMLQLEAGLTPAPAPAAAP